MFPLVFYYCTCDLPLAVAVLAHHISYCSLLLVHILFYYINTSEIPGELLHENLVSSHVKITCYLHM